MKWEATFQGREIGAIGIFQRFTIGVEGDNREIANLAIYNTHEHVSDLLLVVKDEFPFEENGRRYRLVNEPDGTEQLEFEADCIWECYVCGHRQQALVKGFNTTCPLCGSYELHLTDEAKRSKS